MLKGLDFAHDPQKQKQPLQLSKHVNLPNSSVREPNITTENIHTKPPDKTL